jgi:hypothetical protein
MASKKLTAADLKSDPLKQQWLAKQLATRLQSQRSVDPADLLTEPQLRFVADQSKLKAAVCSRRAGKSYSLAWELAEAAEKYDHSLVPYITLTRDTAKNILWPAMRDVCKKRGVEVSFKQNTGDIVFPNGSRVILRGCDDKNQIDKLRGPAYPVAVVDEAQGFPPYLMELIDDVLTPATMDYDGSIIVTGTPNAVCAGPFHDLTTGVSEGWSVHTWTVRDNWKMAEKVGIYNREQGLEYARRWLSEYQARKGWDDKHPTFLREYCGLWVQDQDSQVYRFSDRNIVDRFDRDQADDWTFILGLDLGFNEPSAFVIAAYSMEKGFIRVLESWQEEQLTPSELCVVVEGLDRQYKFESIIADTGGLGKGYSEELRKTYGMPVSAAKKRDKYAGIQVVNDQFANGTIQMVRHSNQDLVSQLRMLQWEERAADRRDPREDRRTPNHLTDALLYAVRDTVTHLASWEREGPKPGSAEWVDAELEAYWNAKAAEIEGESEKEWWELI